MGGWIVVGTSNGTTLDTRRWAKSVQAALRYGGTMSEHHAGRVSMGAWRRDAGEFPSSGTLSEIGGAQVAWVGQCVDDKGDASAHAMSSLSAEIFEDSRVACLNGPFAAVILREKPLEVRVVTDHFRNYPVYLFRHRGLFVASTEIRCIVPWLNQVRLAPDSADMLLRCGELIDRMTMIDGVEMLPPGTLLRFDANTQTERRYWSMRHDGSKAGSLSETADLLASHIETAVRRIQAVTPRLGITLSGGLDSRIILDMCRQPEDVPSFTWGQPGCRDIVCASKFAALVKSPHTIKYWDAAAFPALWSQGVDLTGGGFGVESMYMLPFVPLLASSCDVVLNGLAGDAILGGNFLKYSWLGERDIGQLGRAAWRWRVSEEEDRLVDQLTGKKSGDSDAGTHWAASISARDGARPVERLNDWLYENRVFRNTNCGTMLLRGGVESHSPFFDLDFIHAAIHVRQEHKFKHRLYLEVMKRCAPRSASVAWQRTGIAPAFGFHANLAAMTYHRVVNRVCAPFGVKPFKSLVVADPAGWLRGPWRQQAQDIILSDRALQRGLLNADAVRKLWNEHQSGQNHTRQLGALIAIELFARQITDGIVIDEQLSDPASGAGK